MAGKWFFTECNGATLSSFIWSPKNQPEANTYVSLWR